jgi:hypothetical protein
MPNDSLEESKEGGSTEKLSTNDKIQQLKNDLKAKREAKKRKDDVVEENP